MPNMARPIGRLRKHVRDTFDAITREELPQRLRELVEKSRYAEPVTAPHNKEGASERRSLKVQWLASKQVSLLSDRQTLI